MYFVFMQLDDYNKIVSTLTLPMNPEELTINRKTKFDVYNFISGRTAELPHGSELKTITWQGVLPGPSRRSSSMVKFYGDPKELSYILEKWRADGTKLRLIVTETAINIDVYIESYESTIKGGHGDHYYNIGLKQAVDIIVRYESDNAEASSSQNDSDRPEPSPNSTYTVKTGDNLWTIAQKQLGSGARYIDIYNLNKQPDGPLLSKSLIRPGQVLKMPV